MLSIIKGTVKSLQPGQNESETAYIQSILKSLASPIGAADFSDIPGESIDVIVWLQELPSVLAEKYGMERAIKEAPYLNEGAEARKIILDDMKGSVRFEYTNVFTGFAMAVAREEIKKLAEMPGVYAVITDKEMHATGGAGTKSTR
jgi:hypothetical protein